MVRPTAQTTTQIPQIPQDARVTLSIQQNNVSKVATQPIPIRNFKTTLFTAKSPPNLKWQILLE